MYFSVLLFTTMFRNHSYLDHKYSIRCVFLITTLDCRVHAHGGARTSYIFFFFYLFIYLFYSFFFFFISFFYFIFFTSIIIEE